MRKKPVGNALLLGLVFVLGCKHFAPTAGSVEDVSPPETPPPPIALLGRPPTAPQFQPQPQPARMVPVPQQPAPPPTEVALATPPARKQTSFPAARGPIRITSATAAPAPRPVETPPPPPAEAPTAPIIPPPTEPLPPEEQAPAAVETSQAGSPPQVAVVGVTCRRDPSGKLLCPRGTGVARAPAQESGPDLSAPEPVAAAPGRRPAAGPLPPIVRTSAVGEAAQELTQAAYLAPSAEASKLEVNPPRAPDALPLPPAEPDVPAAPLKQGFGFARDYSWLMGELQYVRSRDVWRLRYAEAEQDDRYGGTVTLVGEGLTADCKNGQIVRVEGQMINPDSTEPRPPYWAKKLRVLKAPLDSEE